MYFPNYSVWGTMSVGGEQLLQYNYRQIRKNKTWDVLAKAEGEGAQYIIVFFCKSCHMFSRYVSYYIAFINTFNFKIILSYCYCIYSSSMQFKYNIYNIHGRYPRLPSTPGTALVQEGAKELYFVLLYCTNAAYCVVRYKFCKQ